EAGVVLLTPAAGGELEPSTWLPSCRPTPIPAEDGAFWVHLGAPDVTAQDTELVVELIEAACTFARDPSPYLREPVVTETDDAVTITWSSSFTPVGEEPTPEKPLQAMDCPANPVVTRTVTLAAPLGDRALLDGSSWPARDIRGQGVW
ncbi:hypothetical protein, partial [Miniimonas arenae]|uniref:hypothetical protein n=1 Tax=Miniimonas arenae TaxID=676201 RepID=UPI0028AD7292